MGVVGRRDGVGRIGVRVGALEQEGSPSLWGKPGDAGLAELRAELVEESGVVVMVEPGGVEVGERG